MPTDTEPSLVSSLWSEQADLSNVEGAPCAQEKMAEEGALSVWMLPSKKQGPSKQRNLRAGMAQNEVLLKRVMACLRG